MASLRRLAAVAAPLATATAAAAMFRSSRREREEATKLAHYLEGLGVGHHEGFDPAMVDALPEPARRYFLHAIAPGTRLAHAAVVEMGGAFRTGPREPWMPMRATMVLAGPHGFVWEAAVRMGAIRLAGFDSYAGGIGRMRFRLFGMVPFLRSSGPDISRSAAGRLAAESIFNPASLLPQRGVRWDAAGDDAARFTMSIDGEDYAVTLRVAPDGRLLSASSDRWGDPDGRGHFDLHPFGAGILDDGAFDGYTLPVHLHGGWFFGTEHYFDFIHPVIERVTFR